jgi:carbamoyl-phosphate synthase small subunit
VVLADGTLYWGAGCGAEGEAVGELCFNTAMTGYQEVMTDPSYAGQIITFTFPHIGNVGANAEDIEGPNPHALGCVMAEAITAPSSFRSEAVRPVARKMGPHRGDGRRHARDHAANPQAGRAKRRDRARKDGQFNIDALVATAAGWSGLEGLDLAKEVLLHPELAAGTKAPGSWAKGISPATCLPTRRMWSRSTMASSARSCGSWWTPARG